jgi:hypothetical protein
MPLTNAEPKPDLTIGFLLMRQFTLASVAGLVESLRFAADESFSSRQIFCRWEWMTCDNQPVTASCGLPVSPTATLDFSKAWDYFVVAGGLLEETRNPQSGCYRRCVIYMRAISPLLHCAVVPLWQATPGCWTDATAQSTSPPAMNSGCAFQKPFR